MAFRCEPLILMGEGRVLNIPKTGDVVLNDSRDGVLKGESPTLHTGQMKLFKAIAASAVIGGSFLIPVPAEARNGWMQGGCNMNDQCYYQKVISKN